MSDIRRFQLSDLESHPWQVNIPDMIGREWAEFFADVQARGIVEPIRVSVRTGRPVVVDGHQRTRAAQQFGLTSIQAIVQDFDSEAEEVTYLSGAARFRRNLTDVQKVALGVAIEDYFRPLAAEEKGGRPRAGDPENNLPPNGGRLLTKDERTSSARAATAVGLSEHTYRRGKIVMKEAPVPVREAWAAGELSSNAAYDLTRKAPEIMREAITARRVSILDAVGVNKNSELSRAVEAGEKTPEQAVSLYALMKASSDRDDRERGTSLCMKAEGLLTDLEDFCKEDYFRVLASRFNAEEWDGDFAPRWQKLIQLMQNVAKKGEVEARTITAG